MAAQLRPRALQATAFFSGVDVDIGGGNSGVDDRPSSSTEAHAFFYRSAGINPDRLHLRSTKSIDAEPPEPLPEAMSLATRPSDCCCSHDVDSLER